MALQPREKKLAAMVGLLAGCGALYLLVSGVGKAFSERKRLIETVRRDVEAKEFKVAQAGLALEQFEAWEKRALPRDPELARSLYQNRLAATLAAAKLKGVHVEPGRTTQIRDVGVKMPFVVRSQGSLSDVVRWLTAFYRTDDLHQIREMSLQPSTGNELQLTATIEALSLPGADRTDRLTEAVDPQFEEGPTAEMLAKLQQRNFFAAYVPPPPPKPPYNPPPPPPPPPVFDEAKFAFLTSILSVDDRPQAWLSVRPTKQTLKLHEGDGIKVGRFTGTVVRIAEAEIEVEQDGNRRVVKLGQTLAAGEK